VIGWLLDTNVVSELRRPRPEAAVVSFIVEQPLESLFISSATFAEIRYGIERQPDPELRGQISNWLKHELRSMFEQRVLPVTEDIMFMWRLLVETGRKTGHTFSQPDLIIAATALEHGLTVVTRDTDDYERAQVQVLNPWPHRP
jgi:predicted nucleic acid-binding protein